MFDVVSHGLATAQSLAEASEVRRLDVFVSTVQKLSPNLVDWMMTPRIVDGEITQAGDAIRMYSGIVQLFRFLARADTDFVAFSLRDGILWDDKLLERIRKQIARYEARGHPWLFLMADGVDISGASYASAHFEHEPTLTPDRGCHCVVQTAGTLVVANVSSLRALELLRFFAGDASKTINELILLGYSCGYGSYFVSELFPCVKETRRLTYNPVEDQVIGLTPQFYLPANVAAERFPANVDRFCLLQSWFEIAEIASTGNCRLSFVIRTLFKRLHLIRRCLISIEYLRAAIGFLAEVVIASDVDDDIAEREINTLREDFPNLTFVRARGRDESGHSRVRNLVAGIKATSGTRVCIIDDDDFYTPQATEFFQAACTSNGHALIIFDTQIMLERWSWNGVKPHRELLGFQNLFASKDWANTLRGWNSIPLCGIIHPGWFVRQIAHEYRFSFDYSEDFVFHLHCLTHRCRPPVVSMPGIGAYQSHRESDDNVSNIEDRTQWTLDTGNGLYELLFERKYSFESATRDEVAGRNPIDGRLAQISADLAQANQVAEHTTMLLAEFVMLAQAAHTNYLASKPSSPLTISPASSVIPTALRRFSLFGRGLLSRAPRIRRWVTFIRHSLIAR